MASKSSFAYLLEILPLGFVKLNTDGSILDNSNQASVGGLPRDSTNNWIQGFSCNIGITNSSTTELWGFRNVLLFAFSLEICKLIIQIGAKSVVDILNSENILTTNYHPYNALISNYQLPVLDPSF